MMTLAEMDGSCDRVLPLPFRAKIEKILQFWRVFEMSSCSWLAWFRRELLQDACIARCLTFSADGVSQNSIGSDFDSISPHLIPRIMLGNLGYVLHDPFCVVSVHFQMWKSTLSTFPLLPPRVSNATWVHCGAFVRI